jgi:hypothetical protein
MDRQMMMMKNSLIRGTMGMLKDYRMEFTDMAQMDNAFKRVAPLEGELETKHKSFNQFVSGDIEHALYRDYPDEL